MKVAAYFKSNPEILAELKTLFRINTDTECEIVPHHFVAVYGIATKEPSTGLTTKLDLKQLIKFPELWVAFYEGKNTLYIHED